MIKLFLADDEPVIVRGLKKLIDWNSLGIEIIGEAFDGKKAEELIFQLKPDIVISDICMPGITGIDILKKIKVSGLNTKVIFLSGYQEFSYAKDAIAFGAIEYLLKPVDTDQLEIAIKRTIDIVRKEKDDLRLRNKFSNYETESTSINIDRFWQRLLEGYVELDEVYENFAVFNINGDSNYFTVLNIEIDEFYKKASSLSDQEVRLIKFAVFNQVEMAIDNEKNCNLIQIANNICVILSNENFADGIISSQKFAQAIIDRILASLHRTVTVGVGETLQGFKQIQNSYMNSIEALKAKYFFGNSIVISYKDFEQKDYIVEDLYDAQKFLSKSVVSNENQAVKDKTAVLLNVILGISNGNKDAAISYCLSTIAFINKELSLVGITVDKSKEKKDNYLDKMRQTKTYNELRDWMTEYLQEVSAVMATNAKTGWESVEIIKVKAYIENNYAENITLEIAAGIACMNSYYFSSFFKKHTGENFKDFLTRVRMEKALKILLTTNSKVYEIAEEVGFNDSSHFSDIFKKYYGSNPMDYKNNLKNWNS